MSASGLVTKEDAASLELRGMKYIELHQLFIFSVLKKNYFSKN